MLSYTDKLATQWADFLLLVGRVVLGWIFVMYGWTKLFGIPGVRRDVPAARAVDLDGYIAVPAEFFVGLALILGFATRYAVLIMLFYMVVAIVQLAHLLDVPEAQRVNQMAHFWKNISMMGGYGAAVHHRRRPILARLDACEEALAISACCASQRGAPRWMASICYAIANISIASEST